MTYGPRQSGGYQFPAVDAVPLRRGATIARWSDGRSHVEVTELLGGRPQWDVHAVLELADGSTAASTFLARSEHEARREFERARAALERGERP